MSKRLLGIVAAVFGTAIFLDGLLDGGGVKASDAYGAGKGARWIFGAALVLTGIYNLAKSPKSSPK
ncbi:MAG TPA: hypothetical protein VKB86_16480 [Pyrinomonadaceae bacterium]|nr:hypothetical protein [Pyrinomonadaceae bacterium]